MIGCKCRQWNIDDSVDHEAKDDTYIQPSGPGKGVKLKKNNNNILIITMVEVTEVAGSLLYRTLRTHPWTGVSVQDIYNLGDV